MAIPSCPELTSACRDDSSVFSLGVGLRPCSQVFRTFVLDKGTNLGKIRNMDIAPAIERFLERWDDDTLPPEDFGIKIDLTPAQRKYIALALDGFLNRHWDFDSKYDYR